MLAGGQSLIPMLDLRLARFEPDRHRPRDDPSRHRAGGRSCGDRCGGSPERRRDERPDRSGRSAAGRRHPADRPLPDPQPGHPRRLDRPRRSCCRVPRGGAGARCRAGRRGARRPRDGAAVDFFQGMWRPRWGRTSVLVAVRFPVWTGRRGSPSRRCPPARRLRHRRLRLRVEVEDGRIGRAGIALFGVAATPMPADVAETALVGADAATSMRPRSATSRPPSWTRPTTTTPRAPCGAYRRRRRRSAPSSGQSSGQLADVTVSLTVNGERRPPVEPRKTLADILRENCGLTGTHLGCEHGVCGACTVLLDGEAVRSCLVFAVQAEDAEVTTVEGLAARRQLNPVQEAFRASTACNAGSARPVSSCRRRHCSARTPPRAPDRSARDSRATSAAAPAIRGCPRRSPSADCDGGPGMTVHSTPAARVHRQDNAPRGGPPAADRTRHVRRRRRAARHAARRLPAQRGGQGDDHTPRRHHRPSRFLVSTRRADVAGLRRALRRGVARHARRRAAGTATTCHQRRPPRR